MEAGQEGVLDQRQPEAEEYLDKISSLDNQGGTLREGSAERVSAGDEAQSVDELFDVGVEESVDELPSSEMFGGEEPQPPAKPTADQAMPLGRQVGCPDSTPVESASGGRCPSGGGNVSVAGGLPADDLVGNRPLQRQRQAAPDTGMAKGDFPRARYDEDYLGPVQAAAPPGDEEKEPAPQGGPDRESLDEYLFDGDGMGTSSSFEDLLLLSGSSYGGGRSRGGEEGDGAVSGGEYSSSFEKHSLDQSVGTLSSLDGNNPPLSDGMSLGGSSAPYSISEVLS